MHNIFYHVSFHIQQFFLYQLCDILLLLTLVCLYLQDSIFCGTPVSVLLFVLNYPVATFWRKPFFSLCQQRNTPYGNLLFSLYFQRCIFYDMPLFFLYCFVDIQDAVQYFFLSARGNTVSEFYVYAPLFFLCFESLVIIIEAETLCFLTLVIC